MLPRGLVRTHQTLALGLVRVMIRAVQATRARVRTGMIQMGWRSCASATVTPYAWPPTRPPAGSISPESSSRTDSRPGREPVRPRLRYCRATGRRTKMPASASFRRQCQSPGDHGRSTSDGSSTKTSDRCRPPPAPACPASAVSWAVAEFHRRRCAPGVWRWPIERPR